MKRRSASATIRLSQIQNPRIAALLKEVSRSGSLRKASLALGMAPGNAHRMVRNEERKLRVRLLAGSTGGRGGGGSRLTSAGWTLARSGPPRSVVVSWWRCNLVREVRERSPILLAVPEAGVTALVAPLRRSMEWAHTLRRGAELELGIAPEAVTIVPDRGETKGSFRNSWPAQIVRIGSRLPYGVRLIRLTVGQKSLGVALTASAVSELGLKAGLKVNVQLKATALRLRKPVR